MASNRSQKSTELDISELGEDTKRGNRTDERIPYSGLNLREISSHHHWKNNLLLSLSFFFTFNAYVTIQSTQSTINPERALGLTSLLLIYGFSIPTAFITPLVIKGLGAKWTLVFCTLAYVPYSYANMLGMYYPIIIASCLLGLCGGPLLVAQATYVTRTAYQLARLLEQPEELVINRLNGVFYIIFHLVSITGNLIIYFVLSSSSSGDTEGIKLDTSSCGADNCGVGVGSSPPPPSPETTQLLFAISTAIGMVAVLILLFGLDDQQVPKRAKKSGIDFWVHSRSVLRLMVDIRMTPLIPLLMLSGLHTAFEVGDFTKAYIACSQGVSYIGLVLTAFGVSSSVFSLIFGQLEKVTDRISRISFGFVCHFGLLVWLYLWQPRQGQIWPLLAAAFVCGVCNSIWRSQVACLVGVMFPRQQEPAFSVMVLSQGFGWVFALLLAIVPSLCVGHRLFIFAGFLLVAFGLYLMTEYRHRSGTRKAPSGFKACPTKEDNALC